MVLVKVHCVDTSVNWGLLKELSVCSGPCKGVLSVNWGLLKELSVCSGPCKGSLCGHIGKLEAFEGVVSV